MRADQTDVQPPRAEEPAADDRSPQADGPRPDAGPPHRASDGGSESVVNPGPVEDADPGVDAGPIPEPKSEGAEGGRADEAATAAAEAGAADEAAKDEAATEDAEPEDELTVAQRERGEYLALAQRTQADFENYRKRAAKETAAAGRRAKSGLIGELLPVVDNLERALASAGEQEEHLADGVRLVHSELISVLARNGVEQFDPAGEKFDPSVHEALSTRAADDAQPGVVLDVVEKGYSLNEVVLRPARVVVSA
jgi:molecular chaperone GrpE